MTNAPTLGRIVHYRGKEGLQTLRAAIVTATTATLDPRGVESGQIAALSSDSHVHLAVLTPASSIVFSESNIPFAGDGVTDPEPGQWAWPAIESETASE